MNTFPFNRIVVVGTTSSGKSTLAKQLAGKIHGDFIELDALHWEPNWTEAPLEVFRQRAGTATRSRAWVAAGNYHAVRDIVWPRAQAVIWLDYSFHIVFWRLFTRTIRRSLFREELWSGNRESFLTHLKLWSEESLFHWLFKTYRRRKRETPILLAMPEHAHLKLVHFKHPKEAQAWFEGITVSQTTPPIA